ncbi:MAG TPA: hypothetical protein VLF66_15740, partial [Thermoanaerobaculia bacterium]|nr:hypothetical protein [Thermoanaerobaculia bacterium]
MRRCAVALLLLATVAGAAAAAPAARNELPPGLAEAAASLPRHPPGARLRVPLDDGERLLGAVAGPDGARAVLRYLGEGEPDGPRVTALTLRPGGVHLAPAATWTWASGERGSLEIEVYRGDLAAFRQVGEEAVPAEVVRPGGFRSVYGPRSVRWGLLLWMAGLAAGVLLLARRYFRLPVTAAWGLLLVTIALVPVAPALSSARLYGPFDANGRASVWRGPPEGPPFRAETARMGDVVNHLVPRQVEARRQLLAGQAPLLTQRTGGGQALLGNGQTAPLALLSLASLPFETPVGQALRAFLKVLLALLGTFVAARLLGARAGFALAAALGYAFCGSMSAWKLQPHAEVMAFWPWVYVAAERLIRAPRRGRPAVLAGAALTGLLLAGHPETAAMGLGAVGLRWVWQRGLGGWRSTRPGLVRFLGAAAVAAGLSAIAVLPLAETIAASMKLAHNRAGGPGWLGGHPGLPLAKAVHMAAAGVLGSWKDGTYRGIGSYVLVSE